MKKYVGYLPEHLVRRFIAKEGNAVLVTVGYQTVDSSRILPVVEKIDRALDQVRADRPGCSVFRYRVLAGGRRP